MRTLCGVVMAMLATMAAGAQRAPTATLPPAQVCDMSSSVLLMQLVDASGARITDARVTVRRVRTGALVERAESTGDGSYRILEDGGLRDLRREGEPFDVTFVRGARTRRARVRIGLDERGCHVRFVAVPRAVVM
jgi:hypothetical protein